MSVLIAIIQGFIQGLTEFLPISSSGHLTLFQHFTGISGEGSLFFSLMLHLGTLAAVIAAFYNDIWAMIKELGSIIKEIFTGQFHFKTNNPNRKLLYMLILATLPLVLLVPLRGFVASITGDKDIVVEGFCFLITAGLLFAACKMKPGRAGINKMGSKQALTIGVMQSVAVFPGISRSGTTISTGMILGFNKELMVKFSFLMGIPAILGGAVFEVGDAMKEKMDIGFLPLFAGMLTAAVVGYASIKLIRWLLLSDKFIVFAWYTLVLGILVILVGTAQHIFGLFPSEPGKTVSAISAVSSQVVSEAKSSPELVSALLGFLGRVFAR